MSMVLYVVILCIQLILYGVGCKYHGVVLTHEDKRKYKLHFLFPVMGYWLARLRYFQKDSSRRRLEVYQMLHPGMDAKRLFYYDIYQKLSILYSCVFLSSIVCLILYAASVTITANKLYIERPGAGMPAETRQITVMLAEKEEEWRKTFSISVPARMYKEGELEELKAEAEGYIREAVKGKNKSLDQVKTKLNFITRVPDNPYKVSWIISGQDLIEEDGTLNNKELLQKEVVSIKACLSYKEKEDYIMFLIGVEPYVWTWEEKAEQVFLNYVSEVDKKHQTEKGYQLADRVGDYQITYEQKKQAKDKRFLFFILAGMLVVWAYWEQLLKRKMDNYKEQCQMIYPEMVSKLTLLLGAGMTLKGAWNRIVQDYLKVKKSRQGLLLYTYEEMLITWNEMESGRNEMEAIEQFGKRIKLRSYLRFSALVSQNIRKGTKGFLHQLELEAEDAQEERKQMAKKLGEEAGTKLLFPMLLMFIIVLMIVMVPAFLSFSEGGF